MIEDENFGVGEQITRMVNGKVKNICDRNVERRARMIWQRDIPALEAQYQRYLKLQQKAEKIAAKQRWTRYTSTRANAELAAATLRVIASIRETACP